MTTATSTYTHDTVFKVLDGNKSMHGGHATWTPGEWMPKIDKIIPCKQGYHLCVGPKHLLKWLGPTIWTAEYRGDATHHGDDKIVVAEARILERVDTWTERTARLFAADCVERVLHLFEDQHPGDYRPRHVINTARSYANGKATDKEFEAANVAVWAAAWAAAWDPAWAAAWDTARDAAWAAARDAEQEWQATRLLAYLNGQAT